MASVHAAWIIVCCVFASTDEQLTQKQEKCVDLVYRIVNKRVRVCVCVCVCVSVSVCVCVFCLFEGVGGEGRGVCCDMHVIVKRLRGSAVPITARYHQRR